MWRFWQEIPSSNPNDGAEKHPEKTDRCSWRYVKPRQRAGFNSDTSSGLIANYTIIQNEEACVPAVETLIKHHNFTTRLTRTPHSTLSLSRCSLVVDGLPPSGAGLPSAAAGLRVELPTPGGPLRRTVGSLRRSGAEAAAETWEAV